MILLVVLSIILVVTLILFCGLFSETIERLIYDVIG